MSRILIVDDELNMLKSYQRIFKATKYEILCASSGDEALQKAVSFSPDIALLDIMMPGMNGYQVCEEWKRREDTKEIEVIFVSGKGKLDDRLKAYKVRASDFLVKPFSKDELLAKVELILEKKRFYLELATTDALTQLGDRKFFEDKFNNVFRIAAEYKQKFSIAIIDIDHFKKVNDTYGHDVGDYILKQVSQHLNNMIRKSDLLARIGGEEFALLLSDTDNINAQNVLERLRKGIAQQSFARAGEEHPHKITISIGYASYPISAIEKDGLFKAADKALYMAKQNGRNRIEAYVGDNTLPKASNQGPA